jgi:hypothetical protein
MTKPFRTSDAIVLKPLLRTNDIEYESETAMELQQRFGSYDVSTARLLADLDVLSRSNAKTVSEAEIERPEKLRKFLEGFFADRSGSII